MHKLYLGIGGNLGDKMLNFEKAYSCIGNSVGSIIEKSSVYETPPWGFHAKENFWNQVLMVETKLEPEALPDAIVEIEDRFERKRESGRYISREMDIDILYYDDIIMDNARLKIPHPLMHQRLFVLVPLVEIAPEFLHPLLKKTNRQLLADCKDHSDITKISF